MRQVVGRVRRTAGRQCFTACLLIGKAELCHKAAGTQHTQCILVKALFSVTYGAQNFLLQILLTAKVVMQSSVK